MRSIIFVIWSVAQYFIQNWVFKRQNKIYNIIRRMIKTSKLSEHSCLFSVKILPNIRIQLRMIRSQDYPNFRIIRTIFVSPQKMLFTKKFLIIKLTMACLKPPYKLPNLSRKNKKSHKNIQIILGYPKNHVFPYFC